MNIKYLCNKLTRDNNVIRSKSTGGIAHCRTLSNTDFLRELKKKLLEEAQELIDSPDKEDAKSELADLYEVLSHIKKLWNLTDQEIEECRLEKINKRGGFDNRIYCDYIKAPRGTWIGDYCAQYPDKYPILIERSLIKPAIQTTDQARKTFHQLKSELFKIIPEQLVSVIHIGSTSINNAVGQPTVDILIQVESLFNFDLALQKMRAGGWVSYGEDGVDNRRVFGLFNKDYKTLLAQLFCFESGDKNLDLYAKANRLINSNDQLLNLYQNYKQEALNQLLSFEEYCEQKHKFFENNLPE